MKKKQRERLIEELYRRYCSGIQINIMDIGKVFAEGDRLLAKNQTLEEVGQGLRAFTLVLAGKVMPDVDAVELMTEESDETGVR